MSGGSHIRAVGHGSGADAPGEAIAEGSELLVLEEDWVADSPAGDQWTETQWIDEPERPRGEWLAPSLAGLAIAGWTGFFVWAHLPAFTGGAAPAEWSELVSQWAMPVLLVVGVLLLALRLSRREAGRFADAAVSLRGESEALEARLSVVNRELSLAREFLASQTRDLESLGRVATQRLSENADRLQDLVRDNGTQVEAIAGVSRSAMENMDRLRGDLPVIANAARDVSNQIGAAGNTAHGQLDELVAGFNRLNEFGQASERQVAVLRDRVDAALAAFGAQAAQLDEIAGARFAALRDKSEAFRAELDGREVEALAAMRHRADRLREEIGEASGELDTQEAELLKSLQARVASIRESADAIGVSLVGGEREAITAWRTRVEEFKADFENAVRHVESIDQAAKTGAAERLRVISEEAELVDAKLTQSHALFVEEIGRRRAQATELAAEQAHLIGARLAEIDAAIAERREAHAAHSATLVAQGEEIAGKLAALGHEMERAAGHGRMAGGDLVAALDSLSDRLGASRAELGDTDRRVAELTEASVRLLELIRASAEHSRTDLPASIGDAEHRLAELGRQGEALGLMLGDAGEKSRAVSDYVIVAQREGAAAMEAVDAFHERTADAHRDTLAQIAIVRDHLSELADRTEALSGAAQGSLRAAIAELEEAAGGAVAGIETGAADRIEKVAARIADEATAAVDRALKVRVGDALSELEAGAAEAVGAGRDAAIQLRDQLAKVNELAGHLESRVALARQRAEEQVDTDFSRRVALLTESLNSNAIDIARALDSDVSDTAWTSYLRGDRGIFTRRAVRLLEPSQARDVAELYDGDRDFREHVNRYIHDFETMLRTMLSTRDGHTIGVTLLSSDMGKLYVAMAQAIERLRD
ncbi:coiled-coil domain-containing protein [Tsuneonella amylolytica]|uniref:ATPase n=1 Tax=Tsuneonella amylolytica TaxID=2338327 RepID=UPI0013C40FE6|nr:ATPase [Tsuneonella amylolytica]